MTSVATLKESYAQLRADLNKAKSTLALTASLPKFFRERATVGRAQEEIKRALENRDNRFLDLVRTHIYERRESPYRQLLRFAGCDFSDLQAYVRRYGENALKKLASEGVYLLTVASCDFPDLQTPHGPS